MRNINFLGYLLFLDYSCSLKILSLMKIVDCVTNSSFYELFHDGGPYHIETSTLIYNANQWIGFYMIRASVLKEFRNNPKC